jgi:lipopolysaccharide/colanic/teichoic acid biosynthesis glycosyltransferase
MAGEFQQGWGAAFSASLLTLRDSLADVERKPTFPFVDSMRARLNPRPLRSRQSAPRLTPPTTRRRLTAASRLGTPARARRHVISEDLFRDVLIREWRRAERFATPFVLLLVELNDSNDGNGRYKLNHAGNPGDLNDATAGAVNPGNPRNLRNEDARFLVESGWSRAIAALVASTRQTDVMGWFEQRAVLGVILTEIGQSDAVNTDQLETLVRRQLAERLDDETLARLSLRLHIHARKDAAGPEGPQPVDPLLLELCAPRNTSPVREATKRAVDIMGSVALLILLSPLYLILTILVKLKSPGPVFFRQVRVGQGAKPFTMFKFRTMHVDADRSLHHEFVTNFIRSSGELPESGENKLFKIENDPRVTAIGRILRRTSLDELPQMWNVLRGDMSLVGPRPPLAYELEQYRSWHWRRVLEAKPGITGLWQVVGRSRTSFDDMVRLDIRYVRTCSLSTDIKILLKTPRAVVSGKGAC